MKVSVLGTGSVGQALSGKLAELGHQVFMGTRNVAESLAKTQPDGWGNPAIGTWIQGQPTVQLVSFNESVELGSDLILFAMNGGVALECLNGIGAERLGSAILLDISNPLDFSNGFPPTLFVNNTDSLGEQIQRGFPRLRVVKTLNTMSNPVMVNPKALRGDHQVFLSGDDAAAKETATELLQSFGWETRMIIDLGDISTARATEMILPLWLRLFGKLQTPFFNFHVNTDAA
jgi:8-hydroxy-5-deazaflavin:NADPH oxidoreductase